MGWIIALIIFGIGGLGYWMHARQPHVHQTEHWLPRNSSKNNADKG